MINKKQTLKNAILSVTQVIVSGIVLFFVYKYLLSTLGVEKLGVWSIVMAISTVAKISDLGFAGGMVKFVAQYTARQEHASVNEIIQTGAISIFVIIGVVLCLAYPVLQFLASSIFTADHLIDAMSLIPYALVSFALLAVAGIFLSSLDGFQRADIRNILMIIGMLLYVILIVIFVNQLGFIGLGYAQVGQSIFMLLASWIAVKQIAKIETIIPMVWKKSRFNEMLAYNTNLQVSTIASLLLEPVTKVFLGKFGDLSMVAYFEMANKLIQQFRAIVVNVNQVLVPVIAQLHEKNKNRIIELYHQTYTALFFVSVAVYMSLAVMIPLISELWIGSYNSTFITIAYIVILSLSINTMVGPAYFSNMGTGHVSINTKSQVLMGCLNIIMAVVFGSIFGGYGVVVSYALAIIIGSSYLILSFLKLQNIPIVSLIPKGLKVYFYSLLLITVTFTLNFHFVRDQSILMKVIVSCLTLFSFIPFIFTNSVMRNFVNKFKLKRSA